MRGHFTLILEIFMIIIIIVNVKYAMVLLSQREKIEVRSHNLKPAEKNIINNNIAKLPIQYAV